MRSGFLIPRAGALLIALTCGCTAAPPATAPNTAGITRENHGIERRQLMVGGVSLGQSEAAVRSRLGSPLRSEEDVDGITDRPVKTLYFEGLEIYMHEDEAYDVKCTSSNYATPDGARVGQHLADIISIYGPGEMWSTDDETVVRYNVRGTDTYLVFQLRGDSIVMIELWFDYT